MKKTLKLALCGLMLAGVANAQVVTLPTDYYDGDMGILPKSFSTDGKVKLLAAEELGEGGNIKIRTYNNSFNIEHSFEVVPQRLLNKRVTERRAIVAIPGELVTLIDVEKDPSQGYWSQMSQEEKKPQSPVKDIEEKKEEKQLSKKQPMIYLKRARYHHQKKRIHIYLMIYNPINLKQI